MATYQPTICRYHECAEPTEVCSLCVWNREIKPRVNWTWSNPHGRYQYLRG